MCVSPRSVYLLGALWPGLVKAEAEDAEVLAVEDQLSGVKLQLLVGAQHLLLPFDIVYYTQREKGQEKERERFYNVCLCERQRQ